MFSAVPKPANMNPYITAIAIDYHSLLAIIARHLYPVHNSLLAIRARVPIYDYIIYSLLAI